jgi:asparagine synthase (glutamine-hydrolysing)
MCGIAGLVCFGACDEREHIGIVSRMCDSQLHRGPDFTDVVSLGPACLGANRLSIIDLSPAAHMPMRTDDGRWWISYNGEVYNFHALREELISAGQTFRSRSDTEVVLRAFAEWGTPCLERFVGMFALALWDRKTATLTLARDRFGKKPLFYTTRDRHFLFASELKALVEVDGRARVDARRLGEWALYRSVDVGSGTLVAGVQSLPAGHSLRVRDGVVGPARRYYAPEWNVEPALYAELERTPPGAVVDRVEHLLADAVRARLVSDVRVGTLCSGGLDSSVVTALAARHLPGLSVFNIAVDGHEHLDESRYARVVAEKLSLDLHVYPLTGEAYRANLVRAVYHSDVPLTHPNSVAFLLVSQFARQRGVTILLSGEGADELFGGYWQRYRRERQLRLVRRLIEAAPQRLKKALVLGGLSVAGIPVTRINDYEANVPHAVAFLDAYAREGLHQRAAAAYGFIADDNDRGILAAMLADLSIFLPPLLRRLDRMSMAASIECRVPFLDHRFVNFVINLPLHLRLKRSVDKWLLKEVAARCGLPDAIVRRRKAGFPLPVADYLAPLARPEFFAGGFCEEELALDRAVLSAAVRDWRANVLAFFGLLTLEIWGQLFVRGEPIERVSRRVLTAGTRPGCYPGISLSNDPPERAASIPPAPLAPTMSPRCD